MTQQLVVGDLKLEGTVVPEVVQVNIRGVDEGELLVWRLRSVDSHRQMQGTRTWRFCSQDVLAERPPSALYLKHKRGTIPPRRRS